MRYLIQEKKTKWGFHVIFFFLFLWPSVLILSYMQIDEPIAAYVVGTL
jgi:hypothetical protein